MTNFLPDQTRFGKKAGSMVPASSHQLTIKDDDKPPFLFQKIIFSDFNMKNMNLALRVLQISPRLAGRPARGNLQNLCYTENKGIGTPSSPLQPEKSAA